MQGTGMRSRWCTTSMGKRISAGECRKAPGTQKQLESVKRVKNIQNLQFHWVGRLSAYKNADDHKSTSSYIFTVGGGAIIWMSRKQSMIALLSSAEAEYIALSEAGWEVSWLRSLYEELGFPQYKPTVIYGNNKGSMAMAKNPPFHKKSKHIAHKWHWIWEAIDQEVVRLESCQDPYQTADILMKVLARPKHKKHVTEMGLVLTWRGV